MQFFLFFALIITLALVFFAIQNAKVVTLTFFVWNFEGSLAFILALTFIAGILTGISLYIPVWWRRAKEGRVQKRRIQELEKELSKFAEEQGQAERIDKEA